MVFVIRPLQELARKKQISLYVCFIDLTRAYDSDDRTLLWTVLAHFGVPHNMISVIRQLHDDMRGIYICGSTTGCNRGGSLWSRAFAKGARARAPPVQHLLRGGYKCGLHAFQGGQRHYRRFGASEEEKGGGGAGGSNCRRASPVDAARGILYDDDDVVVSQSPEQLKKMMGVIVVVCTAFGLTISEAKSEIMCLRTKWVHRSPLPHEA